MLPLRALALLAAAACVMNVAHASFEVELAGLKVKLLSVSVLLSMLMAMMVLVVAWTSHWPMHPASPRGRD